MCTVSFSVMHCYFGGPAIKSGMEIENIETNVIEYLWTIKYKDMVRQAEQITIFITLPHLRRISLSGSGRIFDDN